MNCATSNLTHLFHMSRSVCQMLANLKKRKRKLLSCVFTFHKTWNKVISHCSLAVTATKRTKKCDTHAKLLLNLLFGGRSKGFRIWFTKKYSQAYDMLQKWVLISAISLSVIFQQWAYVLTTSLLKLSAEHRREEKECHFNSDTTQLS